MKASKTRFIGWGVVIIALAWGVWTLSKPAGSVDLRLLWIGDDLPSPSSSNQWVVAALELANNTSEPIQYWPGNSVFSGYSVLRLQSNRWGMPGQRPFIPSTSLITLMPSEAATLEVNVDCAQPCKVGLCYTDGRNRNRFRQRLPASLQRFVPQRRDWLPLTSEVIDLRRGIYPNKTVSIEAAAQQGERHAQFRLAGWYWTGNGRPRDIQKAIRLYEGAAAQKHNEAAYHLATIHEYGVGVTQDIAKAVSYYRQAANRSHARAQEKLCELAGPTPNMPRSSIR